VAYLVRDILIGMLHRSRSIDQEGLVPRDRRALLRVRELCGGHPAEQELLEDLIACEPHFRTQSDARLNSFVLNVEDLWQSIFAVASTLPAKSSNQRESSRTPRFTRRSVTQSFRLMISSPLAIDDHGVGGAAKPCYAAS
jgi:hypothetical protein